MLFLRLTVVSLFKEIRAVVCADLVLHLLRFPKQQESRDNGVEVMVQAEQAACVLLKWVRSLLLVRRILFLLENSWEGVRAPRWGHLNKQRIVLLIGP